MENISELESTILCVCMIVPFTVGVLSMVYLLALAGSDNEATPENRKDESISSRRSG